VSLYSVALISVIMLSVAFLNVDMLNVVASKGKDISKCLTSFGFQKLRNFFFLSK
jgi:hypothetical protein